MGSHSKLILVFKIAQYGVCVSVRACDNTALVLFCTVLVSAGTFCMSIRYRIVRSCMRVCICVCERLCVSVRVYLYLRMRMSPCVC